MTPKETQRQAAHVFLDMIYVVDDEASQEANALALRTARKRLFEIGALQVVVGPDGMVSLDVNRLIGGIAHATGTVISLFAQDRGISDETAVTAIRSVIDSW